ncbi:hypothetical protein ERO13_D04G147100v2 [Gossypium hirsutum]|uniref:Uncharacterized protein n=3 Tax=Gossypium TaxID=3633 RepID=A0ABM2ZVW8_GOSHI|nr:uncharacterized protein LOC121215943 [Gossypium hirsutum]KAG4152853.1 hypothetical protein ERO13_D04G147100v2 [Gossypium hirsutum]TYG74397.1 hypothetical protein ES288_D04G179800v1 [Gossypium darwinii]TYI87939.1 hypothetical protein E1A91_D04G171900v1 [Gossypium mustelinum]
MKFFSELGSCYRPSTSHRDEDKASLRTTRHAERTITKSGGGSASSPSRHWRPVLQAIREDGKVTEKRIPNKNKSKGKYTSKPYRVSHDENSYYSRNNNSEPMVIPAFSPTPFMF